jgi:hypothetical protein
MLRDIASITIESFTDHRIQLFDCEPLRRALQKLRVEERAQGTSFRLVSPRDTEGHGDSFTAFSLALFVAHEMAGAELIDPLGGWFGDPYEECQRERHLSEEQDEFRSMMLELCPFYYRRLSPDYIP